MSDRANRWLDLIYKLSVVIGGVAIGYMNATFAKKDDLEPIRRSLEEIKGDVRIIRSDYSHIETRTREMAEFERSIDSRLRAVELRR